MLIAALAGFICAALVIVGMFRSGMLRERSGLAVLLAAVASFYPVFAVIDGGWAPVLIHLLIFAAFAGFAVQGFRRASYLLAAGLTAHGVFDLGMAFMAAPGPTWWPAFCGVFDITAGMILVQLIQKRRIAT